MPHVCNKISYPQDILLWKKADGTVKRIPRTLILISIRELNNYMLNKASDGDIKGAVDVNGNAVISDTVFHDNLPFILRPCTEHYE